MSRTPYGFIKPSRRGSAYCTQGGRYWIAKVSDRSWVLMSMANKTEGREREVLGRFPTLRDAVEFFRTHHQTT